MARLTNPEPIRPNITVFVPRHNTIAWMTIPRGSAIVAEVGLSSSPDTSVDAYFETRERHNEIRAPFANLVNIAGGRCHWRKLADGTWSRYPTQSKAPVRLGDLVRVGEFDDYTGELVLDPNAEVMLAEWIGYNLRMPWDLRAEGSRYRQVRGE